MSWACQRDEQGGQGALGQAVSGVATFTSAQSGAGTQALRVWKRWIAPLSLVLVGLTMLVWTWGTWPDVLVDFGGELYVPWRLSEGDVLYRDVAYFTGPLSPCWNALVFRILGPSLLALVIANLAVLAAIAFLLHRLLARIAGGPAATAALAVFLTLFAFAQLDVYGNSNYVCPYAHETTHGALLALLALTALGRWLDGRRVAWIALAGVALGLAFLTKVEVFLAIGLALGLGLGLARAALRAWGILLACALVPVVVAFLLLATALGAPDALRGTLGAWAYVFDERITSLLFYRRIMGTDRIGESLRLLLSWTGGWLALLGPGFALAFAMRKRPVGALWPIAAFAATAVALFLLHRRGIAWLEIVRPLPLFALLAFAAALFAWRKRRQDPAAILRAAFAVYALALLAKMILHAQIAMYGFALAMPAAMLVVVALLAWIPDAIERARGSGAIFRAASLGALAIAVLAHLSIQRGWLERKTVRVGEGKDAFLADRRGDYVNATLAGLSKGLAPGESVAVLPEGVMINYLARRRTPTRHINTMPPEVLMFGEDAILADLRASPPGAVVLVHKPTVEYGLPWFGIDYGVRLMAWVRAAYEPVALYGQEPLQPGTIFGVRVLLPRNR